MNKRGDLTSKQIVTLSLLILGAVVVVFFFGKVAWGERITKETCSETLLIKAATPEFYSPLPDPKEAVPIKCKTRKVCITDKRVEKGDCKDTFGNVKYDNVRVSSDFDKQDIQIKKFLAEEQAECWSMVGQGQIPIFSRLNDLESVEKGVEARCLMCSHIAFDKSIIDSRTKAGEGELRGLGKYMINEKIPGKETTYWQFLTGGLGVGNYDPGNDKLSFDKSYIIIYQELRTTKAIWALRTIGVVTGAGTGAYLGAKISAAVPIPGARVVGTLIGAIGGGVVGWTTSGAIIKTYEDIHGNKFNMDAEGHYSIHLLMEYNARDLALLKCRDYGNLL